MVNLYVFNPALKLRFLSGLVSKGSKRILSNIKAQPTATPSDHLAPPKFNLGVFDLIDTELRHVPQGGLIHDANYYTEERESGLCVFRLEDTLFKVHKCYLMREPCAFRDMFSLPFIQGSNEGDGDERAIPLSDTAEQFRDLLWALHATPTQLCATTEEDLPSLERLVNIALLANKYCIVSYEEWSLDRILSLTQRPSNFLRHAPPQICARVLEVAFLCNHQQLLDITTQRLVARMLWSDIDRRPVLEVAERRGITKLQGVAYYKELIELEGYSAQDGFYLAIPPDTSPARRACLISAHHSLVNLWECICLHPPTFLSDDCQAHTECLGTWTSLWSYAASSNQTLQHSPADVLGRLKSMMILLKKTMVETESMSLGCVLVALESITAMRDDIIAGLIDHFQEH